MSKYKNTSSERAFLKLLQAKFRFPTYTVLSQLPISTVTSNLTSSFRRADALVIGAYASRQHAILGFEFKASRVSWLQELKNPGKAEEWAQFCDEWYVAASEDIVREEEVPPKWGFFEEHDGALVLKKPAEKLSPKDIVREAFFSIFQALITQLNPSLKESALRARYEDGVRAGSAEARGHFTRALKDIMTNRTRCDLDGLDKLLAIGPYDQRDARIRLVEQLVERFTSWKSLAPTENALKALDFIAEHGLVNVRVQITTVKTHLAQLLADVEESEKAILEATREAAHGQNDTPDSIQQGPQ